MSYNQFQPPLNCKLVTLHSIMLGDLQLHCASEGTVTQTIPPGLTTFVIFFKNNVRFPDVLEHDCTNRHRKFIYVQRKNHLTR